MIARRLLLGSWPPVLATLVALAIILHQYGVSSHDLVSFGAYLLLGIALPGVFFWRLLLRSLHDEADHRPTWFEDLSLGTIFGFGVQLPVYLFGVWIGRPELFFVLPLVVIVLSLATSWGRGAWRAPTNRVDVRVSWSLAALIVYGSMWLARYVFPLRPLSLPPYKTPSVDETFHQALISELLHRFPPEVPFLLGTRLDYHWFVHAQMAADHWATGLDSVVMLRALMPLALLALTILGVGAIALRLSGRSIAAFVAPALLVVGAFSLMGPHYDAGGFTEAFLSRRYISSPSQAYGFMMALPPIMLTVEVLRSDRRAKWTTWLLLGLTLLALTGSKATFLPVFVCGGVALVLIQLVFRRTFDKTAAALTGLLIVMAAYAQIVLFGSSSGGMRIDFFLTAKAALRIEHIHYSATAQAVMAVTMLIGWTLYGVGAIGLVKRGLWKDRRTIWMFFSALAGIAVAFVFFRSGLSQLWFQRSVAPLIVLLSAWGIAELLPSPVPRKLGWWLAGLAALAGLGTYAISRYAEEGNAVIRQASYHEVLFTAIAPFAIVAVYLLARLLMRATHGPRLGVILLVTVLLGLSLSHVYTLGYDTATQRAEPHRIPPNQFAPGGVEAATWIRDHSGIWDIVATNVHCRKPDRPHCDNRNFWISAYTERRVLIEGWGYTQATNSEYTDEPANAYIPAPDPKRLAINDAAFLHPSTATVSRLVDTYGVKFLFVSKKYPVDLAGLNSLPDLLEKTYHGHNYAVFKVK